jgi:hypothetical protein
LKIKNSFVLFLINLRSKKGTKGVEYLTLILKVSRLLDMTENDRNMRTLVLCFVLAVLALIPLRFVEFRQGMIDVSNNVQVLGETIQQEDVVILPNAEISP